MQYTVIGYIHDLYYHKSNNSSQIVYFPCPIVNQLFHLFKKLNSYNFKNAIYNDPQQIMNPRGLLHCFLSYLTKCLTLI